MSPGLAGSSTVARPSFMAGATAACSGAPPSSSSPANPEAAATAPSLYGRRPPPGHPARHMEPSRAGAPLLQPLTAGHRPAAQAGTHRGRRDTEPKEERGGTTEEQQRDMDLHLWRSNRPVFTGNSTSQRRRCSINQRRRRLPGRLEEGTGGRAGGRPHRALAVGVTAGRPAGRRRRRQHRRVLLGTKCPASGSGWGRLRVRGKP
jgi:hypothetical protein